MPKLIRRQLPIKTEAELVSLRAETEMQKGMIEFLSMMTDIEIPTDDAEVAEDE